MRRIWLVLVTLLVLATLAPRSLAADGGLITVGHSIGPIELGMQRSRVVQLLGAPRRVERYDFAAGGHGTIASYRKHGGAFRITYVRGTVVGILTTARFYRTAAGVGPGSSIEDAAAIQGFGFDQCTGGYARRTGTAYTFFVSTGPADLVRYVHVVRSRYFDC